MTRFAPVVVSHATCLPGYVRLVMYSMIAFWSNALCGQNWEQLTKVIASDRDTTRFGYAVALSGDFAVVGTYQETKDVNGNNPLPNAGAAYIFMHSGCDWNFVQKIVASDRAAQDNFGYFVDIEGDFIMVGALREDEDENGNNFQMDAGAVYVFKNISGTWTQTQKLVASDRFENDAFSVSLAMSGNYAIIGAYAEDEDANGMNTVPGAGSAYVFLNTGGIWSEVQKIHATVRGSNDNFGISVAISGDYIVSGAYNEDEDADEMNTLSNAGAAYVFKNTGGTWSQVQKIVNADRASNDRFGWGVAIAGNQIVSGAPNEDEDENGSNTLSGAGSAYIFENQSNVWTQVKKIVPSDRATLDGFGSNLAISGNYILGNCYREDEDCAGLNTLTDAGSAYMFKKVSGVWSEYQKICRNDRDPGDFFSFRVDLSGDYAVIGSHLDDDDEDDMNPMNNSGSAYFFKLGTCVTNIVSVQSGDWNDPDTWNCNCIPDSTQDVFILSPHTVTVTDTSACDSLFVYAGATLHLLSLLENGRLATISGTFQNEGTLAGSGNKLITSGGIMNSAGALRGTGELEIADGGTFSFTEWVENRFYITIRNHGTLNWNNGYYTNGDCMGMATIINEADGEFNMGGNGDRFLSRTNLINYGVINKTSSGSAVHINAGCADGNGYFDNISPGVVNVTEGALWLDGNGTHSGIFNNNASLIFRANMTLTTSGNITGSGVFIIEDTTTINIPYTFAATSITNNGNITGSGDKVLPSGTTLTSGGTLSGTGMLEIQDGASLVFAALENRFPITIVNHGTLDWSAGYYTHGDCLGMANIINEADGEMLIGGFGARFLSKTNLTNYGLILKNSDAIIHINSGCGNGDGYFNNVSPGVVNVTDGTLWLSGNGTHSGSFINSATLIFSANMTHTTDGNLTGTGTYIIEDTTTINIPYTFSMDELSVNGTLTGTGPKTLATGSIMNINNTWNNAGEIEIQDGAVLNYQGNYLGNMVRNHGVVNWNMYNFNACGSLATFINETDGELNIAAGGYFSRTNLVNYGLISKSSINHIYMNAGCGDDGTFDNITPGVVNILEGEFHLYGDGEHSGVFNNSGLLHFAADHELTAADNLTGTGDILVHDSLIIDIPYTLPVAEMRVEGAIVGMGDKILPAGGFLDLYNIWNVDGELTIQDGAVLNYQGYYLGNMIRNHGIVNWNLYNWNACGSLATFINETDGEFNIAAGGYFSRTNLINNGLISKSTNNQIYMNAGCGDDGTFDNITPGVVNILEGELHLYGDGVHSGLFNNSGLLDFTADHELITADNITGTGDIQVHDSLIINIPYALPVAEIRVEGVVVGTGDKILPAGAFLDLYNIWNVDGELTIQDGAMLNYQGYYLGNMIRNHGVVNWNLYNWNACGSLATFINESDGEFNIAAGGYFSRTNLVNSGIITKTSNNQIYMNGGCGDDGTFENNTPGVVNILDGEFHLFGDGNHSGIFNNSGLLNFNADHELTTADNITGSGDIQVHDSLIINVPYTFPAAEIRVEGTVTGMGAKVLPAGAFLDLYNTWNVDGELTIQDGATVDYKGIYLGNMIRNHGTVNWNSANFNSCGAITTFTNESDGELNIGGEGTRYFGNTNLTNMGLITKSTLADIHFNSDGSCNYGGSFENLVSGELNIISGLLYVH